MSRRFESLEWTNFIRETSGGFDSLTHVNDRLHELHKSNFRLFHASNLSVLSFRIFLLMYPGSESAAARGDETKAAAAARLRRLSYERWAAERQSGVGSHPGRTFLSAAHGGAGSAGVTRGLQTSATAAPN